MPGLGGGGGGPLFPPPPQEALTRTVANANAAKANRQRRAVEPNRTIISARQNTQTIVRRKIGGRNRGGESCQRDCGDAADGAVVETVSVTISVVWLVESRDTEDTLKVQLLFAGKLMQRDGESGIVPEYPFNEVNVIIAEPELPGLATTIVGGFAVAVNVGGGVTVSVIVVVEVA